MPYQCFANLGCHAKAGASASQKARSVGIAKLWIYRHGKFKPIALLQVLIAHPYLFNDFFGPEQDYASTMKRLSKDCLQLIGDDMIQIYESSVAKQLSEKCLRLEQELSMAMGDANTPETDKSIVILPTKFNELINRLEWLGNRITSSNALTPKKLTLSVKVYAIGKNLEYEIDNITKMLNNHQETVSRSVNHLLSCRTARDMVEKVLERRVCAQWHTNPIDRVGEFGPIVTNSPAFLALNQTFG